VCVNRRNQAVGKIYILQKKLLHSTHTHKKKNTNPSFRIQTIRRSCVCMDVVLSEQFGKKLVILFVFRLHRRVAAQN